MRMMIGLPRQVRNWNVFKTLKEKEIVSDHGLENENLEGKLDENE